MKVVDLGADFRLRDPAAYEKWYGAPHVAVELQKQAVYGLTEFYRDEIRGARLVAGTGCNAATVQYALRPLIAAGLIDLDRIICDLKNGISGAGRSLKENMLFAERCDQCRRLRPGRQAPAPGRVRPGVLGCWPGGRSRSSSRRTWCPRAGASWPIAMSRAIRRAIHDALARQYADEPFVTVLPFGQAPGMGHVTASNQCHIGVIGDRKENRALVVSTLDNLTKGSSGQAVQNANLMLGEDGNRGADARAGVPLK